MKVWNSHLGVALRVGGTWLAGGFLLALLLAGAAPIAVGERSFVVESGSMTPTIETGDVVVLEPIGPRAVRTGQIVSFREPGHRERLITHRVIAVGHAGRYFQITTQGDANTTREHWRIPANGRVGRVLYRIPKLGFAVSWIKAPAGCVALLIVPGLLLIVSLLQRIWRPVRVKGHHGAPSPT